MDYNNPCTKKMYLTLSPCEVCAKAIVNAGIEEVIYSVQQHQTKIRFLFVGNAEDRESKTIMKKLMLLNNVMHVSFSKEVHLYMALAQIHLFLSLREGFGNVAIEAASFGIPTLAYNVVGVRDSVVDNVTGRKFEYKKTSAVTE